MTHFHPNTFTSTLELANELRRLAASTGETIPSDTLAEVINRLDDFGQLQPSKDFETKIGRPEKSAHDEHIDAVKRALQFAGIMLPELMRHGILRAENIRDLHEYDPDKPAFYAELVTDLNHFLQEKESREAQLEAHIVHMGVLGPNFQMESLGGELKEKIDAMR